jgi:hypothetical protein
LLADSSALKMEAIHSAKMSVHTGSTQRHIPEDSILQFTNISYLLCMPTACYSWTMALNADHNATFNNMLNRKEVQEKAG